MKIILKNTEDKQQKMLHPARGATSTELEHPLCASSCHCARCTADELSRMRPPIRGRPCSPQGRRWWWWWWRWRTMGTTCACPFDYLAQGALCTCRLLTRHAAACLFLRRQHCWPSPLHPLLLQQRGGGGGGGGRRRDYYSPGLTHARRERRRWGRYAGVLRYLTGVSRAAQSIIGVKISASHCRA